MYFNLRCVFKVDNFCKHLLTRINMNDLGWEGTLFLFLVKKLTLNYFLYF